MSFSEALSFSFNSFPRFFSAMLLWALILYGPLIGLILLMVLGVTSNLTGLICLSTFLLIIICILIIYIYLRLALFMQACVIENISPVDSLKRSWIITKGNVILIFVTILIIGIIGLVITIPFTIASNAGVPFILPIGMFLNFIIMSPVQAIIFTLIYLKLIKKQTSPPLYPQYQKSY